MIVAQGPTWTRQYGDGTRANREADVSRDGVALAVARKNEALLMERNAELEAILARINEHADVMRNQVGTGPLVADIRHGFQKILDMTREAYR